MAGSVCILCGIIDPRVYKMPFKIRNDTFFKIEPTCSCGQCESQCESQWQSSNAEVSVVRLMYVIIWIMYVISKEYETIS